MFVKIKEKNFGNRVQVGPDQRIIASPQIKLSLDHWLHWLHFAVLFINIFTNPGPGLDEWTNHQREFELWLEGESLTNCRAWLYPLLGVGDRPLSVSQITPYLYLLSVNQQVTAIGDIVQSLSVELPPRRYLWELKDNSVIFILAAFVARYIKQNIWFDMLITQLGVVMKIWFDKQEFLCFVFL